MWHMVYGWLWISQIVVAGLVVLDVCYQWCVDKSVVVFVVGAGVKMEHHFQAALDPRKQELLEARFLGARVSQVLRTKTRFYFEYIFN